MLWVVLDQALGALEGRPERAIHFAPEALLRPLLEPRFGTYETSSFDGGHTDHNADLRQLPFPNASYDFLIASHVLEHIKEDRQALSEIRRVLRPGGIAVLPVPLSAKVTVEYDAPNPKESGHVRAPGLDYYDRYSAFFSRVDIKTTNDFPGNHHLLPDLVNRPSLGVHWIPICYA